MRPADARPAPPPPAGYRDCLPLALLVAVLSVLAQLLAGPHALALFDWQRGLLLLVLVGLFLLSLLVVVLVKSLLRARSHVDPGTGQVDVAGLWRAVAVPPLPGAAIVLLAAYGVTASANFAEIYRATASVWHDALLWRVERPLFVMLLGSWLDRPAFWDGIYFQMWSFVLLATAAIYAQGGVRPCARLAAAVVIAFFLTRAINLALPTAGPVFFQPGLFQLDGTASKDFQELLLRYMAGELPQPGVYPGTMAMPSLHIALTALAAAFLARQWRRSLYLSVPWLLLIWASTVMLGWHYALDGAGGLLVAWGAATAATLGETGARGKVRG